MINLSFFPSRTLAWYMVRLFLTRSLAVLVALVLILMTLDLLGESGKILAVPGNTDADLWRYVSYRLPMLVSRFLPFSVLLGTLIAFVGLNQNSEVVAMKAAGLSAHQILAPLVLASIGLSAILFAFNEGVVVNSTRVVTNWSDNDYKPVPRVSGTLSNVWVLNGDDLIRARIVGGRPFAAQNVTIYDRSGGVLQRVIEASRAVPRPESGDWMLENVRLYSAGMNVVRNFAAAPAMQGVTPNQLTLAKVDPTDSLWSGARPGGNRNGAWLYLFRRRQFQPGDGECRNLPAARCRLGPLPPLPSDRRNCTHQDRRISS